MTAKSAFIRYIETTEEKTFIASHILSQLPDWFGIPESTLEYVKNCAVAFARQSHYEYIQVKTVKKGYYQEYDKINTFYEALGFREFECLPTLWAEANPCQIYVQFIGNDNPVQTS